MNAVGAWDQAAFALIHTTLRTRLFDLLMPTLTDTWTWVLPIAAIVLYTFAEGGKRGSLLLCSGIVLLLLADGSSTALKSLFLRPRPYQSLADMNAILERAASSSFPSNHATNAFALAALLRSFHRKLVIPLFAIAAVVGYSRIYLGDHYPLDVLAGALLGTILGLAAGEAHEWLGRRWKTPEPRPEGQGRPQ